MRYSFRTIPYGEFTALPDLSRKRERERLSVRREPYWQRLAEGAYLGFRRGPDTWLARYRDRDGKQQYKSLGDGFDFDEAKRIAEGWCGQLSGSTVRTIKRDTVRAALEAYVTHLRDLGRVDTAADAEGRFSRFVWDDSLAYVRLEAATRDDFEEWRARVKRGRASRTVNRNVRTLKAALNYATDEAGHVGNPKAWRLKPLRDDIEDAGETQIFLNPLQRRALIAAATPSAADFFRGLDLTGARPKELADATVGDFDGEQLRLASRKARLGILRVRYVEPSTEELTFFKRQAKGKLPSAPLFTEDGKQPWRRHIWAREMRAAIASHNENAKGRDRLPVGIGAYAFRHARISELLQIHKIDPVTVAKQTGTSIVMIEKFYYKFIPTSMREKLDAVKDSA